MSQFSLRHPVRFTHTDPAGFVFYPRYFEMLQAVVEDWFTHSLALPYAELVNRRRLGTPTAATQCTFMRPCRLGEELDIAVVLEHIGNSSLRIRFIGRVAGDQRLEAVSTLVLIDLDDGRPRPFPADIRAKLEAYQSSC